MKVLLDENLPHDLRRLIVGHDCFTVAYMKWNGLTNGKLLATAADAGFDVMLTSDAGIEFQHDVRQLPLSVMIVRARTSDMDDLAPLVPAILQHLAKLEPRSVVKVS